MSHMDTTGARAQGFGLTGLFARFFDAVQSWSDRRATRKALARLTDRELDDIGLCRGDIDQIARRF